MNFTKICLSPTVDHASPTPVPIADKERDSLTSAEDKNTITNQYAAMNARTSAVAETDKFLKPIDANVAMLNTTGLCFNWRSTSSQTYDFGALIVPSALPTAHRWYLNNF
ncbi:hypothetical protein KP509_38G061200 [Ceratopteris richardii]|uniref:Uncharacterized protein n=1 Tax=Ceratopteris richardii TaxID=49495 RepID=A0A8T2Q531_CERRI|nr:hypothetical protein KP509_38G061200 [Ceratopteris richardii]